MRAIAMMPQKVPILTYHSLDKSGAVISTPPTVFEQQMRWLAERGYVGIRLMDLINAWDNQQALPPKPVVLTFDDAFANVADHALPVLKELRYTATIFAVAEYCGKKNDWPTQPAGTPILPLMSDAALREAASIGMEIGAHTLTHPPLAALGPDEVIRELAEAKIALGDRLGVDIQTLAYPYGSCNDAVVETARRLYRAACTVQLNIAHARNDRLRLPRLDMYYWRDPHTFAWFAPARNSVYLQARRLARSIRPMRQVPPSPDPRGRQTHDLVYCCPLCKGSLEQSAEAYRCDACGRAYPVIFGIPDFRVFPDPYISIEDDHRKGLKLAERYETSTARQLMEFYWSITPDTPPALWRRYMRYDLAGEERGRHWLDELARQGIRAQPGGRVLELGCRTGGMLAAMAERSGVNAVGIDIAFRWLIVAKKRLQEQGLSARLVCCCAQYLPFSAGQFDLILGGNILEHAPKDQGQIVAEGHRTLCDGGALALLTVNRFSLAREPHVNLWGVGFLPRKWMDEYVRRRRGVPYEHVRLISAGELRRIMRQAGFASCQVDPPLIMPPEAAPSLILRGLGIYNRIRRWPIMRQLLVLTGPLLQATARKQGGVASHQALKSAHEHQPA